MTRFPFADFVSLFVRLVGASVWRTLKRTPLHLVGTTTACLLLAGLLWFFFRPAGPTTPRQTAVGVSVALCYAAAGLAWGLHRAAREGALHALALYEGEVPKLLDAILVPLVGALQCDRKLPLSEARKGLTTFTESWLGKDDAPRRFAVIHRAAAWIARQCMRSQLALIESVLTSLEAQGETHLSAMSLKNYLRDQVVRTSAAAVHARIRLTDYAVAATVLLLLTIPAVACFRV
jgi:hypothetical protein